MTLAAQLTTDLSVFFNTDEFAVAASYTPSGGTAKTINVIFDKDYAALSGVGDYRDVCLAKASDVSAAKPGETLVIGSTTYKIKEPPRHTADGITELELTID